VDKSSETREEHVAWALKGLEGFTKAMKRHNETGDPGALVEAFKHAYGTEINLLDADLKELAEVWTQARLYLARQIREHMVGRTAKKSPPKDVDGHKWKKLPKGWTDESRKKFWNSLTSRAPKHKVTQCIKRMEGKVDNPGAFCASLADRVIPGWREEAAKERRKKKKAHVAKVLTELEKEYDYKPSEDGRGLLQFRYDYNQIPQKPTKDRPRSMIPGKDQLGLDPDDPLYRKRLAKLRDPLEPLTEDKDRKGADEDDGEEKPHSQLPGADESLTMEMDRKVASQWITRDEMKQLCPPCAVRMKKAGMTRVHVSVMRNLIRRQMSVA